MCGLVGEAYAMLYPFMLLLSLYLLCYSGYEYHYELEKSLAREFKEQAELLTISYHRVLVPGKLLLNKS